VKASREGKKNAWLRRVPCSAGSQRGVRLVAPCHAHLSHRGGGGGKSDLRGLKKRALKKGRKGEKQRRELPRLLTKKGGGKGRRGGNLHQLMLYSGRVRGGKKGGKKRSGIPWSSTLAAKGGRGGATPRRRNGQQQKKKKKEDGMRSQNIS